VLKLDDKINAAPMITEEKVSEFIHKLSHDIRGIANNLMGYTTLLEEENNPDYLEGISRLVMKLSDRIKSAVAEVDEGNLSEKS